jgi:hypothetical protein
MIDSAPAFRRLVGVLHSLEIPYMVGGSLASSFHGIPRSTNDVDLVAKIHPAQVEALVAALRDEYYTDPPGTIREAIERRRMFNFIHFASSLKFDVYPLGSEPYAQAAFARRSFQPYQLSKDDILWFYVSSPEDTVLAKLRWYQASSRALERQWSDVLDVVRVQGEALDRAYLRQWAAALGVTDLVEAALA